MIHFRNLKRPRLRLRGSGRPRLQIQCLSRPREILTELAMSNPTSLPPLVTVRAGTLCLRSDHGKLVAQRMMIPTRSFGSSLGAWVSELSSFQGLDVMCRNVTTCSKVRSVSRIPQASTETPSSKNPAKAGKASNVGQIPRDSIRCTKDETGFRVRVPTHPCHLCLQP